MVQNWLTYKPNLTIYINNELFFSIMFSFRETVFFGKNAISKNVEKKHVTCRIQVRGLPDNLSKQRKHFNLPILYFYQKGRILCGILEIDNFADSVVVGKNSNSLETLQDLERF